MSAVVKKEFDNDETDDEEDELFTCETCKMSFSSIGMHIKKFHRNSEIVIQMQTENPEATDMKDIADHIEAEEWQQQQNNQILGDETGPAEHLGLYDIEYLDNSPILADEEEEDTTEYITSEIYPEEDDAIIQDHSEDVMKSEMISGDEIQPKPPRTIITTVRKRGKEYRCDLCQESFNTVRLYNSHMKHHKITEADDPNDPKIEKKYECDICNTIFATNKSLRLHSRMHNEKEPKGLYESLHLKDPADETDGPPKDMFFCVLCQKSFEMKFQDLHMRMHSDEMKFQCSICNKNFDSLVNLDMHINAHKDTPMPMKTNSDPSTKKYECGYCGRGFSRPHEKVKHERIHTGEKPHSCEICGKTFRVAYCLTLHMRTHDDARPYVCQHCNKRFKAHSVYNHHLNTHSNLRPYVCTFCPKAFKTSVQLAGHKNSHTKPFNCTECNRPFATLYAVRLHIKTHQKPTNNLKHSCSICGATYARSFALRDHIKDQHSDVAKQPDEFMEQADLQVMDQEEEDEDEETIIPTFLDAKQDEAHTEDDYDEKNAVGELIMSDSDIICVSEFEAEEEVIG